MSTCPHNKEGVCQIASGLTQGHAVRVSQGTCDRCTLHMYPRMKNEVTCGIAVSQLVRLGIYSGEKYPELVDCVSSLSTGPGTELKKLISWFYSPQKKKCQCETRIQKMNKWGPDGCEQRMPTILRWLKHSAIIAGVPYVEFTVEMVVRLAIHKSRKKVQKA